MSHTIDRFLDETLALMVEGRSPEHRDVFTRQIPPASHKSMGVIALTAPEIVRTDSMETTNRQYLTKCFTTAYRSIDSPDYTSKADGAKKRLFHSFVIGSFFATGIAVTAIAEAGPGRWVAMFTCTKKPDDLAKMSLFNDVRPRLGDGWQISNSFASIDRQSLYPFLEAHYDRADVRPDTLGYLCFRAAATGQRTN